MNPIRVLLTDDHMVVREGLKLLIESEPDMKVVGEASDGKAAIHETEQLDPDVVVMDVSLPDMNGAQATEKLRKMHPDRKVVALTVHEDNGYLRLMLEAGAMGYVLKRAAAAELVQAIRTVAGGERYLDPSLAGFMTDEGASHPPPHTDSAGLSEREVEVMRRIALGYSNKEIAARLRLSIKTIETYKMRSMEKLAIRSRVEIVQYAARRGWLQDT
jgi:DNA-binding NarL/FixJ family response regulator